MVASGGRSWVQAIDKHGDLENKEEDLVRSKQRQITCHVLAKNRGDSKNAERISPSFLANPLYACVS